MSAPNVIQRDTAARQTATGLVLPLPSPLLAMMPAAWQSMPLQWFIFPVLIAGVAPNSTKSGSFTTDINHGFVAFYGSLEVRSSDNQTERNADPATFVMTDTQTNVYAPVAVPIDIKNAWGSAATPAIWPVPLTIQPNNGIILNVTNQSAANTNTYNFAMVGALVSMNG